jgi:ribosomal protein S18 acetylase RimI-like enzyme
VKHSHASVAAIALATQADAWPIADLSRTEIEHGLGWGYHPQRIGELIDDPHCNVIVARGKLGIDGFAILQYAETTAHLVLFCVHPARRRCGIGRAMMQWFEVTARVAGINAIQVELRVDNTQGLAFYRAQGFRDSAFLARYYRGRVDGIRMHATLTPKGSDTPAPQ